LGAHIAPVPTMGHAQRDAAPVVLTNPVERSSAPIADQRASQWIDPLLTRRWTVTPRSVSSHAHNLTTASQFFDVLGHFMSSRENFLIRASTVIDDLTLVKTVVQDVADRTLGAWSSIRCQMHLGIQFKS